MFVGPEDVSRESKHVAQR